MANIGDDLTKQALIGEWWSTWFASDYSWAGLTSKPIGGVVGTIRNLQDYWATERDGQRRLESELESVGELVRDPFNNLWHIVHMPFEWRDGSESPKAKWSRDEWDRFNAILNERQKRSDKTDANVFGEVYGSDRRAQFQGAIFDALPLRMTGAEVLRLNTDFDQCYVRKAVRAKSINFGGGTSFRGSLFCQEANFDACTGLGAISFDQALFIEHAYFRSAKFKDEVSFSNCRFANGVSFDSAEFECWSFFDSAEFLAADFPQTRFSANAWFHDCKFHALEFGDAIFERQASFSGSDFSQAGDAGFWNSAFEGDAGFDRITWPDHIHRTSSIFRNAHFHSMADFRTESFFQFAIFNGARFDAALIIDRASAFSDVAFQRAVAAAKRQANDVRRHRSFDQNVHELEGAFRALKLAAERHRDRALELRFHQLELKTRRMQTSTPLWERTTSWLYDAISLYGNSVLRPLLAVCGLWLTFGTGYWLWNAQLTGRWEAPELFDALRLSASSIFRPFEIWSRVSPGALNWQSHFVDGFGSGHALSTRLILSLESTVALILFFLVALALRRKFQVS